MGAAIILILYVERKLSLTERSGNFPRWHKNIGLDFGAETPTPDPTLNAMPYCLQPRQWKHTLLKISSNSWQKKEGGSK